MRAAGITAHGLTYHPILPFYEGRRNVLWIRSSIPPPKFDVKVKVTLEAPESAAAHKIVVHAGVASRREREIRLARPEVADFAADTQMPPHSHIQADAAFDDGSGGRLAGV